MKFSLRLALGGMAIVAIWFAALSSGSNVAVEITSAITRLLVPLSLALAICDAHKERRPFWIGFFILGTYALLGQARLMQVQFEIARAICGPPPVSIPVALRPMTAPAASPATANLVSQATATAPVATYEEYNAQLQLIRGSISSLTSLAIGVIGGIIAAYMARNPKPSIAT